MVGSQGKVWFGWPREAGSGFRGTGGAMGEVLVWAGLLRCRGDSGWPGARGGGRLESKEPGRDWGARWGCIRWPALG